MSGVVKSKKRMLVVSNMWPDQAHPSSGIFVKRFVDQAELLEWNCDLAVMRTSDKRIAKACRYIAFYAVSFLKALFHCYDIVYIHYPSFSAPAVLLANRIKQFKIIVNVHGSDVLPISRSQQKMHRFTEMALERAERVVVPSEYFADIVRKKYGLHASKVFAYPSGGVDQNVFHPLSGSRVERIKTELGLKPDLITVCFAGRITEGKGWDTYLKAVAEVFSRGRQLNALLIGSGDQDAQCTNLVDELGLGSTVVRLGLQPQERLCELYNVSDVFVFPGRRNESLGLVALEAMACGTPVIASDFAAPKYYVKDGLNGIKTPVGDSVALADAMESLLSNRSRLASLVEGALSEAQHYTTGTIISKLESILDRSCEKASWTVHDDSD